MVKAEGERSEDLAVLWLKAEPAVRAFVAATVWDAHHAEDVLQEVATVVAKNYDSYDASRPFPPWCLGIARLKVLEYFRANSRDRTTLSNGTLLALESAAQNIAEDHLVARRAALQACVRKLRGRQRQVIEMKYLLEVSIEEIAKRLATSVNAIGVTLHRARTNLRECVKLTLAETAE
ncbi:MAG: sigma-70 family RNA polymerase sigma factor [Planctomycetota bacterium]